MKNDFVSELKYLSLGVRMKRISDYLLHQGRKYYDQKEIAVEPNWYLLLKLLERHYQLSLVEISEYLYFSHPSVVNLVKKMKGSGYLVVEEDEEDGRKQLVRLSHKGKELSTDLNPVWKSMEASISEIFDDEETFLTELKKLENGFAVRGFLERVEDNLDGK